jgi:hypothetical protein
MDELALLAAQTSPDAGLIIAAAAEPPDKTSGSGVADFAVF